MIILAITHRPDATVLQKICEKQAETISLQEKMIKNQNKKIDNLEQIVSNQEKMIEILIAENKELGGEISSSLEDE